MALGKHLFSFRTQQLSPAAAIILRKWETSTVPNYTITPGKARGFVLPQNARGKIRNGLRLKTYIKKALHTPRIWWHRYRSLRYRYQVGIPLGLLLVVYSLSLLGRPLQFSYAGDNCTHNPVVLPELFASHGDKWRVSFDDTFRIGSVLLAANKLCITPIQPPGEGVSAARVSLFGLPLLFQKTIDVGVGKPPRVTETQLDKGLAVSRPLRLPTSQTDRIYSYRLHANAKTVNCSAELKVQVCDVEKLELRQATPYTLKLERYFSNKLIGSVFERSVTTLSPVSIASSSISANQTVYARPLALEFVMDKPIQTAQAVLEKKEGDKLTPIAVTTEVAGSGIKVVFPSELARSSEYQLTLKEVEASDGSTLIDKTYVLPFSMSGGPKVTGVNIGRSGVAAGTTVVVTFDQNLSPTQDIVPLVKVAGGLGGAIKQGNQLRFSTSTVPVCGTFSVSIAAGIQSEHGVVGETPWSYGSRTLCYTVGSIGTTARGRSITSYTFGGGSQTILYVGATHGNERGTYSLLSEWVDELDRKAGDIPADKKIVVIPALNRDGLAAGTRRNANNVDLNRNFPTANWKADVTMPGGEMVAGGGGSAPLSEPESRAIASFTTGLSPRLVLTYHSIGSLVTPNEAGVSSSYASIYASLSGYYVSPKSAAGGTFEYDTTGAYEDWLYESPGIAAILVELGSHSSSSSSRNFPAMWAMLR